MKPHDKKIFKHLHGLDNDNTLTMDKLMCFNKKDILAECAAAHKILAAANMPLANGLLNVGIRDYLTRLINNALDEEQHDNASSEE